MKNKFAEILISLANDPKIRKEFETDPDAFLSRVELSEEEKRALKARDPELIASRLHSLAYRVGSLTVVGTGIRLGMQMTPEALESIKTAEKVLYVVADYATGHWIKTLNPSAEALKYGGDSGKSRSETYSNMTEQILSYVRRGYNVCAVFYGHPGIFVQPSHDAIRKARKEGYKARMLPGISSEDCLFADLGVDPAMSGCLSYEATDFLLHRRPFSIHSSLILWQIGVIGELGHSQKCNEKNLLVLIEYLEPHYGSEHPVIVYAAAQYPICDPVIQRVFLSKVPEAQIRSFSTLYIPPKEAAKHDSEMAQRLGIS